MASLRWLMATAGSPVAVSMVASARGTVEIGFMAARTRSPAPLVIPPPMRPPQHRAVGHPALDPARAVALPLDAALHELDLVVGHRTAAPRRLQTVADL